jgi:Ino eighty subunit 1
LDLFLPRDLSSVDRARAFLWLIYHYLESPKPPNPFDDEYSRKNLGKAPFLRYLSDAAMEKENVDTPEEIEWGNMMSGQRNAFLQRLVSSMEYEKKAKTTAPHFVSGFSYSVCTGLIKKLNRCSSCGGKYNSSSLPFTTTRT